MAEDSQQHPEQAADASAGDISDKSADRIDRITSSVSERLKSDLHLRLDQQLTLFTQELEQSIAQHSRMLKLLHDIAVAANLAESSSDVIQYTLSRICEHHDWCLGQAYLPQGHPSDELIEVHTFAGDDIAATQAFQELREETRSELGISLANRVFAEQQARWTQDLDQAFSGSCLEAAKALGIQTVAAFPILAGRHSVGALTFFSGQHVELDDTVIASMASVGVQIGRVLERQQAAKDISEAIEFHQRRIGQTLHDGVIQQLSGLSLIGKSLERTLEQHCPEEAEHATTLLQGLRESIETARAVMRGLHPVPLESSGLQAALHQLASDTQTKHDIQCRFECAEPLLVENNETATQLYYIVQEAVMNACRHAEANSIVITVTAKDQRLILSIVDDGIGFSTAEPQRGGVGTRIMQYRAGLIDAQLDITSQKNQGTTVTCVL